jgi:hypothetical protein
LNLRVALFRLAPSFGTGLFLTELRNVTLGELLAIGAAPERRPFMARTLENPDRNFSTDGAPSENFESLRAALDLSKPVPPYNEAAQVRIGKVISNAALPSRIRAPVRRSGRRSIRQG